MNTASPAHHQVPAKQAAVTPPYSLEAEQSVLGTLLLENTAWDKVGDKLCAQDFYSPANKAVFSCILDLLGRNQPADTLTVADALRSSGELEKVGGETYLYTLANTTPTVSNVVAYADIVREYALSRQLLAAAQKISDAVYHPQGRDGRTLLDQAEQIIFRIAQQRLSTDSGPLPIGDILSQTTEKIDQLHRSSNALTGISTGFSDLDEMTSGLQEGELIVVAARPSMGKTAFSMNIAEHAAMHRTAPVLVFSMEMPSDMLAARMLSSLGRINQNKVRTGKLAEDDWPRITSAVGMLSNAPLFIDDSPALSPTDVRARARRLAREQGGKLGLIIVDYLQLMQAPQLKENRNAEISAISRSLKLLAREMAVPVIALSQLNRSLEQRTDKRPVMSDIRESGAIEQDADLILFIYRDEVYQPQTMEKGVAEIIIAKQRNGPIGKVKLTFLGEFTRFENYVPESVEGFSHFDADGVAG